MSGGEVGAVAGPQDVADEIPSIDVRWSSGRPPWIETNVFCRLSVPPTSLRPRGLNATMPGMRIARLTRLRPVGIAATISAVIERCCFRALHVDDRRLAGDRDRLGDVADPQVGVHRGDERAGQLDAFAPDGVEPRQRERHRVGARPQVDDPCTDRSRR